MHNFALVNNWFDQTHRARMDSRWPTMRAALNLFLQRGGTRIVETGCVRQEDDYGAGYSSVLFCQVLSRYGGHLWTVDISADNLSVCARLTDPWAPVRTLTCQDSVAYLLSLGQPGALDFKQDGMPQVHSGGGGIDLLYLDSYDYPIVPIVRWLAAQGLPQEYRQSTDEQILAEFGHLINPCQAHCLAELQAAWPQVHDGTVILIDDNNFPGGGKSRLAKCYLADHGWQCVLDFQQTLWIKGQ